MNTPYRSADRLSPAIEASSVSKAYSTPGGTRPVLRGVDLSVEPGEFVAIVGPSGSGKTTLLYCLAGLESVESGAVSLAGRPLAGLSETRASRLRLDHVGFVFQSYNLINSLTVRDNVALPARLAGKRVATAEIDKVLDAVGLLSVASNMPAELSGGQQQRVAIARVLIARPAVVFADEPTGALDSLSSAVVLDLLAEVAAKGSAVVMVTHNLDAAARADRVLVLRAGAVQTELLRPASADILEAIRATVETVAS